MKRSFSSVWSIGNKRKELSLDFTSFMVQAQNKQRKNSEKKSAGGAEGRMKLDERKAETLLLWLFILPLISEK